MRPALLLAAVTVAAALAAVGAAQELVTVTGTVTIVRASKRAADNSEVAIWLKPLPGAPPVRPVPTPQRTRVVQRDKHFEPRFLVVPVGTVIDFPNADPFFHNVFSMFDGKRFDLGLYEGGSSRSVTFSHPGVCYLFCNIHPEMSGIVVVADSPYSAVSTRAGGFTIPGVPAGRYLLTIWHDRGKPERPGDWPREVVVSAASPSLGAFTVVEADPMIAPHKNKFGHDYHAPPPPSPIYR